MAENDPKQDEGQEAKVVSDQENKGVVSVDPKQERMWGMFCHLAALASLIIWIPGANILGPLAIWLIKKNEMPLVDQEGKESMNFQISLTIYGAVSFALCFIFIGFVLMPLIAIAGLVLIIMASVKTHNGEKFRYPFTIRFIK